MNAVLSELLKQSIMRVRRSKKVHRPFWLCLTAPLHTTVSDGRSIWGSCCSKGIRFPTTNPQSVKEFAGVGWGGNKYLLHLHVHPLWKPSQFWHIQNTLGLLWVSMEYRCLSHRCALTQSGWCKVRYLKGLWEWKRRSGSGKGGWVYTGGRAEWWGI